MTELAIPVDENIFRLPDLGEGLPEAEILEWHVKPGDRVETDQLLLTVETAKAVVEVPSPMTGRIDHLFGQPGDLIATGEPLIRFGESADADSSGIRQDSGTVVGQLERAEHLGENDAFVAGPSASTAAFLAMHPELDPRNIQTPAALASQEARARRSAMATRRRFTEAPDQAEPLRGVRRQMAAAMTLAHSQVVPVTLMESVDIHRWSAECDPTIRLVRAVMAGCIASPMLNAWAGGEPLSVRVLQQIDLGIAVDTDQGLFVPVLRNIGQRDDKDLREGLNRLRADVKARTIPPAELINATITLSNYGTLAGRYANPVVVPPQVAIIGAGVIREEVIAWKGQPAVHPVLPVSITFDHRIATGGEAARFLKALVESLEAPASTGPR